PHCQRGQQQRRRFLLPRGRAGLAPEVDRRLPLKPQAVLAWRMVDTRGGNIAPIAVLFAGGLCIGHHLDRRERDWRDRRSPSTRSPTRSRPCTPTTTRTSTCSRARSRSTTRPCCSASATGAWGCPCPERWSASATPRRSTGAGNFNDNPGEEFALIDDEVP